MTDKQFNKLKEIIKAGDCILINGQTKFWEIHIQIAYACIRYFQKRLFGKNREWKNTHQETYFNNEHIISFETPKCIWDKLENLKDKKLSVYRYTKKILNKKDITVMRKAADKLIGIKYDKGQLIDIAGSHIFHAPFRAKFKLFDLSPKRKVCSVCGAIIYRALTKSLNLPKIFSKLNKLYWSKKFIKQFKKKNRWDLEVTYPDNFSNTEMFDNEFTCIFKSWK